MIRSRQAAPVHSGFRNPNVVFSAPDGIRAKVKGLMPVSPVFFYQDRARPATLDFHSGRGDLKL